MACINQSCWFHGGDSYDESYIQIEKSNLCEKNWRQLEIEQTQHWYQVSSQYVVERENIGANISWRGIKLFTRIERFTPKLEDITSCFMLYEEICRFQPITVCKVYSYDLHA